MLVVYEELRRRAAARLRREPPGHVLQPTALVHEAYLRLVGQRHTEWQNRAHFFAVASEMMRRILVDHARRRKMAKRSGGWTRVTLDERVARCDPPDVDVLDLDLALSELASFDLRQEPGRGVALLRRSLARRNRSCARHLARDGRPGLAARSRLAVPARHPVPPMAMTPERWRQISEIFHAALAQDPDVRDAFLDDAYGADPALRHEVESLMAAHDQAGQFGDTPVSMPGSPLEPGMSLGPYRIDSLLGVGGMGEVYRAHDPRLGRGVAIKVLPSHLLAHPERLARFEREARLLASLNHPHIGAIYGVEEFDGGYALVMELVEGEDLAQRIARGPIPLADALPIAKQIAEALEAAHEQGIIHRDLKPANVKCARTARSKCSTLDWLRCSTQHRRQAMRSTHPR